MNLSAPFLMQVPPFKAVFVETMPYVDFLFGNETEALTWAETEGWETTNIKFIATRLSLLPSAKSRKRTVVITQGCDPTVVCINGNVSEYPVIALPKEKLVDTNGAGDSNRRVHQRQRQRVPCHCITKGEARRHEWRGRFLRRWVLGRSGQGSADCGLLQGRCPCGIGNCTAERLHLPGEVKLHLLSIGSLDCRGLRPALPNPWCIEVSTRRRLAVDSRDRPPYSRRFGGWCGRIAVAAMGRL